MQELTDRLQKFEDRVYFLERELQILYQQFTDRNVELLQSRVELGEERKALADALSVVGRQMSPRELGERAAGLYVLFLRRQAGALVLAEARVNETLLAIRKRVQGVLELLATPEGARMSLADTLSGVYAVAFEDGAASVRREQEAARATPAPVANGEEKPAP